MSSRRQIGKPIAVRHYDVEGVPDRKIVLVIGQPIEPGTAAGDWSCPVLISGLPEEFFYYAEGVDAIQALQSAMRCARNELEKCGLPLTWLGQEPGDLGLARPVYSPFGLWFERRLEQMMDAEIERVGEIVSQVDNARRAMRSSKKG